MIRIENVSQRSWHERRSDIGYQGDLRSKDILQDVDWYLGGLGVAGSSRCRCAAVEAARSCPALSVEPKIDIDTARNYVQLEKLGEGTYATVYKVCAASEPHGDDMAVKGIYITGCATIPSARRWSRSTRIDSC